MVIKTSRLHMISCDEHMIRNALKSDRELALLMGVKVASGWREYHGKRFEQILKKLADCDDTGRGWWTYFAIHEQDQILVGTASFHGPPSSDGEVEIAYEVAPLYRESGFGLEMAEGLIQHAFKDTSVLKIAAQTYGHINSSNSILQKLGFQKISAFEDAEDGLLWLWVLTRNNLPK